MWGLCVLSFDRCARTDEGKDTPLGVVPFWAFLAGLVPKMSSPARHSALLPSGLSQRNPFRRCPVPTATSVEVAAIETTGVRYLYG